MATAAIVGHDCAKSMSVTMDAQRDRLLQLQLLLESCSTQGGAPRLSEVIAGVKGVFNALQAPIERLISCLKLALDSDLTLVVKLIEFEQTAAGSLPTCVTLISYRRPIAGSGSPTFCFGAEAARKQRQQQQVLDSDASFAWKVMSLSGSTGDEVLDALLAMRLPATAAKTADAFMRMLVALASVCVLQEHLLKRCLQLLAPESGQGQGNSRMDESCSDLLKRACNLANHIATHMNVAAAALSKFSGLP